MAKSKRQSESQSDKAEENAADKPVAPGSIGRFKALTKQLLGVSREQLATEQHRYEKAKRGGRKRSVG